MPKVKNPDQAEEMLLVETILDMPEKTNTEADSPV
jgi:hypothetical protein